MKDSDKVFDIELQNALDDDLPLRTRFYQSMIDIGNLLKGQHYYELPTSFVIFICKYDHFRLNLPIYTFQNRIIQKAAMDGGVHDGDVLQQQNSTLKTKQGG